MYTVDIRLLDKKGIHVMTQIGYARVSTKDQELDIQVD